MTRIQELLKQAMTHCCLEMATEEVSRDFYLLRLNQSAEAHRLAVTFLTLPSEERLRAALAFATLEQERTGQQRFLVEAFRARQCAHPVAVLEGMPVQPLRLEEGDPPAFVIGTDIDLALLRQASTPLPKAKIRQCFLSLLKQEYEREIASAGSQEYECVTPIGSWRLVTDFDFGGAFQFRVGFLLQHEELPKTPHRGGATLGSMLGLGELGWDTLTHENLEIGAQSAVILCNELRSRLIQAALKVQLWK